MGVGSNLGDRAFYLQSAVRELKKKFNVIRTSLIYETPPLIPQTPLRGTKIKKEGGAFLNTVLEIDLLENKQNPKTQATELLKTFKKIEKSLGRKYSQTLYSPREIDLDLLLFGDYVMHIAPSKNLPGGLVVPHKKLSRRNFVLTPLKELCPFLKIPGFNKNILQLCRLLKKPLPTWMNIVNITPDSFSETKKITVKEFETLLQTTPLAKCHIWDLGAQSTRPKAHLISSTEEWKRLEEFIDCFRDYYLDKCFRPLLSIDTCNIKTAQLAIEKGANIINDVSGLGNLDFLDLLKSFDVDYVLMHSLSVPADLKKTFSSQQDPVAEIKKWLSAKCQILEKHSIRPERVIFDPGIGFGKTAQQSLEILKRIREFSEIPLRIGVGHSRKSFMNQFSKTPASERTPESIGVSLALAQAGVDILRVHLATHHAKAHLAYQWV